MPILFTFPIEVSDGDDAYRSTEYRAANVIFFVIGVCPLSSSIVV